MDKLRLVWIGVLCWLLASATGWSQVPALAAHCFERLWDRVFGVSGVSDELMQGRETVFLKKIREKVQGFGIGGGRD